MMERISFLFGSWTHRTLAIPVFELAGEGVSWDYERDIPLLIP